MLLLGVVVARVVELLAPRRGERAHLVVGAGLHLGLVLRDLGSELLERLELLALAGVEDLVEEAHTADQCTGDPRRAVRHAERSATMTP